MVLHSLPFAHPARMLLEMLFRRSSVIDSAETFQRAGFVIRVKKSRSLMRVASHPTLAGYVFKVFFVTERQCAREKSGGWENFPNRCKQAERIRAIIQEERFQHFKAPRKWLFHPPYHPSCGPNDQPLVLVAEYQDLLPRADNEHAWLHSVTEAHLDELYSIINHVGGASYRPDNIVLTEQGKFAFIDTEHSSEEGDYEGITPYLSSQMRRYWSNLIAPNADCV